jgi:hypothetical protein
MPRLTRLVLHKVHGSHPYVPTLMHTLHMGRTTICLGKIVRTTIRMTFITTSMGLVRSIQLFCPPQLRQGVQVQIWALKTLPGRLLGMVHDLETDAMPQIPFLSLRMRNTSYRPNSAPGRDSTLSPFQNQVDIANMGVFQAPAAYGVNGTNRDTIDFDRDNFANYQDEFSGFKIVSSYHARRSSGPSSRLGRSVGPVAHPLSGPSVLLNGSKRSPQQSTEPDKCTPARRQKRDGDDAKPHGLVDDDNDDGT